MKDYYYILGVKPDATATEIKAAYRKLSKKFHPDMNGGDTFFEERFKEIQEAHETLIDPSTRQRYDSSRGGNSYQKQQEPPKAEKPIPPVILAFSINKTALSSTEEFTVSWQTLNAETVTIQPFNIQVDANGNKSFRIPKLDAKLETIKIELIAQNRFGNVLRTVVLGNLEYESSNNDVEVVERKNSGDLTFYIYALIVAVPVLIRECSR